MKKIIISAVAVALVICMAIAFGACGNKDNTVTTTEAPTVNNTTLLNAEDGKVTDESEKGRNGAAGDLVSDISEGLTDMSEKMNG